MGAYRFSSFDEGVGCRWLCEHCLRDEGYKNEINTFGGIDDVLVFIGYTILLVR